MDRRLAIGCLSLLITALTVGCERKPQTDKKQTAEADRQNQQKQRESDRADRESDQQPDEDESAGDARTITIQPVDNEMKYKQTEITVQAGEKIHIVFDNTATAKAMKHNVVVLTSNEPDTAMEIARAGWKLPDSEYVPDHEAILAHTPMSDPGETVEVTFEAPAEPGKYMYLCTFPGHYPSMKGTMVVEEG